MDSLFPALGEEELPEEQVIGRTTVDLDGQRAGLVAILMKKLADKKPEEKNDIIAR